MAMNDANGRENAENGGSNFGLGNKRFYLMVFVGLGCLFGAIMYGIDEEYNPELLGVLFDGCFDYLKMYDSLLKLREKYGEFDDLNVDASMVPSDHASKEWLDSLHAGSLVDALDMESKWYCGHVVSVDHENNQVTIHFRDWPYQFDETMDRYSGRIAPYRSQAIGGRHEGGLPGWPLLPLRDNKDSATKNEMIIETNGNSDESLNGEIARLNDVSFINDFELLCDKTDLESNGWLNLICKTWYDTGKYSDNNKQFPIWLNGGYLIYFSSKYGKFVIARRDAMDDVICSFEWHTLKKSNKKSEKQKSQQNYFLFSNKESKHYQIKIKQIDYENSASIKRRNKRKIKHDNIASIMPRIDLNNGVSMPFMAFGTAGISYDKLKKILPIAIENGYTMIDTGYDDITNGLYFNHHKLLSKMMQQYGRTNLFISTKIEYNHFGYMSTIENIKYQIEKLKTEYLDLVVLSLPTALMTNENIENNDNNGNNEINGWLETWRALECLYKKKRIRALGVSQFSIELLEQLLLLKQTDVALSVVRGWRDPLHPNNELAKYCQDNLILFQAFSPLGGQHLLKPTIKANPVLMNPTIKKIANKLNHKYTKAQIVIKWNEQQKISLIIKSTDIDHIKSNIATFALSDLSTEELSEINYISYFVEQDDTEDDTEDDMQDETELV